ncbi:MAG TPA: winged helix-turn-helix domain-containing protein [Vicinamibacterales bacterium]|nr:winged helix-turn-helix domain-containing protein [Vicinamibacterales bacterium]
MAHERRPSFAFGPFLLDVSEQTLTRDGRPVPLTPKLFDVLRLLVEHHGHLIDKETFIERVWDGGFVEEGALTRSVSMLRKALGDTLADPVYIETVPKRGYRFIAPVNTPQPATRRIGVTAALAAVAITIVSAMALTVLRPQPKSGESTGARSLAHAQITFTGSASAPAISRDGQRVAYIAADASGKHALVSDLAGGASTEILSAPELGYPRWSPDDRHLLISARGPDRAGVYVVSTNGAAPRQVAPKRYVACWSPDGSLIAVPHFMGGEISVRTVMGEEHAKWSLAGTHWSIWDVDWSGPAGLLAVVSNDYQGHYTIWTVRPDGSDQRKVLEETGEITTVRWAPEGTALFYSHRKNKTVAINRVALSSGDSASQRASIVTGLEAGRAFSMSGDGRRVLYARTPFHSNLWLLDLDHPDGAGEPRAQAMTTGTAYIERPRISPDGTTVAFNVGHEPSTQLYTMPLSGGRWTQLTDFESTNVGAAWSPDGTQIAFVSTQGQIPQVWTMDARGGAPRRRSTGVVSDSFDLAWSPAGITYQNPGNRNYTVLSSSTGDEHPLVTEHSDRWIFSPVTNSQGSIAVSWNRRPRGIWVIDPASGRDRLIYTVGKGSAYPIGWSPQNDFVYVVEGEPAELREVPSLRSETMKLASILKVPADGGEPTVVARLPFDEIGVVAMTPDARKLVVPVFSSRSDIWLVDDFYAAPPTVR